jgi:competence transcription factor ComK
MSNNINEGKSEDQLKRLSTARKELETDKTIIFQDLKDECLFVVQSNSDKKKFYIVQFGREGLLNCYCPDCKYRGIECKHINKVKIKLFAKTEFNKIDIKSMITAQAETETITIGDKVN